MASECSDSNSDPVPCAPRVSEAASNSRRMSPVPDAELGDDPSPGPSSLCGSEQEVEFQRRAQSSLSPKVSRGRPALGSRHSSKNIVPRDQPEIELKDETYSPTDARSMSPRRTSEEVDKLEQSAKEALIEHSKAIQATLLSICDRVELVKNEHEKLEGGNRFLQSYIGELIQTNKLTASGSTSKGKGKVRDR